MQCVLEEVNKGDLLRFYLACVCLCFLDINEVYDRLGGFIGSTSRFMDIGAKSKPTKENQDECGFMDIEANSKPTNENQDEGLLRQPRKSGTPPVEKSDNTAKVLLCCLVTFSSLCYLLSIPIIGYNYKHEGFIWVVCRCIPSVVGVSTFWWWWRAIHEVHPVWEDRYVFLMTMAYALGFSFWYGYFIIFEVHMWSIPIVLFVFFSMVHVMYLFHSATKHLKLRCAELRD